MERPSRSRLAAVWVAAAAIGGLLSMHALDPTVLTADRAGDHSVHADASDSGWHGAIGLCVFVLGAAVGFLPQRRPVPQAGFETTPPTSIVLAYPSLPGRRRLADLCVLRL